MLFNIYSKLVTMFYVCEHLPLNEAREGMKRYFEALGNELGVFALENKAELGEEADRLKDGEETLMLSIKDLQWKMIEVSYSRYVNNPEKIKALPSVNEQFTDSLDYIMSKSKFFERNAMAFSIKFAVMGGSPELQILCQNFGTLFEVSCLDCRPNPIYSTPTRFIFTCTLSSTRC